VNSTRRSQFIQQLIRDITAIGPAGRFEEFGHFFLQGLLNVPLVHRGTTTTGNPSGYTVDTYSDHGDIVGEYSVDAGYFEGKLDKPVGDFEHARKLHPKSTQIHLLSNQEAGPKMFSRAFRFAGRCGRRNKVSIVLYDARRIAELIVDRLLEKDQTVDDLAEFAPSMRDIQEEYAASHAVPKPAAQYQSRAAVEEELRQRLSQQRVLKIAGIGGSGKSQIVAALVDKQRNGYDSVYWIAAAELQSLEDLQAISITRGGSPRNVSGLLRRIRCLLVLDDLKVDWDEAALAKLCGEGSRIVITQRMSSSGAYRLPFADETTARSILEYETDPCPESVFRKIYDTIGGHPLALSLMNSSVRSNFTWHEVAHDCDACVESLDDRQERVADRILARILPTLTAEVSLFRWLASPACERHFAKHSLRLQGLQKLEHFCLTSAASRSVVRLHDIVFASVMRSEPPSPSTHLRLLESLDAYLTDHAYEDDLALVAVARLTRAKLEELMRSPDARSSFLLALLHVWPEAQADLEIIGDPMRFLRALGSHTPGQAVVSVPLETMEFLYRRDKEVNATAAKPNLQERVDTWIAELNSIPTLTERSRLDVLHHKGKALKLLGQVDAARAAFEEVLARWPGHHAARLQLIRVLAKDKKTIPRALALAEEIFEAAANERKSVTTTVLLATVSEVFRIANHVEQISGMWQRHGEMFKERLAYAADIGLGLAYTWFSPAAKYLAYNIPKEFRKVWESLPIPNPEEVQDAERFAIGDTLREAAVRLDLPEKDRAKFQADALEWISSVKHLDDYRKQTLGKLYVEMGRFKDAKSLLIPLSVSPWAKYWLSKAEFGDENYFESLRSINEAIADPSARKYLSTFLAHRYEVRRALRDPDALADLDEGIRICENEKYKLELQERRALALAE
jgi:NB-ARC domain